MVHREVGAIGLALILTSFSEREASAQPFERPAETRPVIPPPGEAEEPPEFILPQLPPPSPGGQRLSHGPRILVHEFRVTGATVFPEDEIAALTAPYENRPVTSEDLQELRDKLTLLYVQAGYVNSGALLPDQDVSRGIVEYRMVEGRLDRVELEGNRYFRDGVLRSRLLRGAHTPLNVRDLEEELELLQQDPRIRRVQAELIPGDRPGEAVLRTRFEEEPPYRAALELSNHEPPSIGAYRARLRLADENLLGFGDVLRGRASFTEGLEDYEVGYEIPVTQSDTTAGAWYQHGESDIVEDPFDATDIESESQTLGLEIRHPVHRTPRSRLELALLGEYRESENFVAGHPFSFVPGPDKGRSVVSAVRFRQDWLYRDLHQVLAGRSMLSLGIDALGATVHRGDEPDGQYLAWLGQLQWARRLERSGLEILFRTDVQLSTSPLLSLEQFSVGGYSSVRGYRENELVADNGVVSSLELRLPLWSDATRFRTVQLAAFGDVGHAWNTVNTGDARRGSFQHHTLASIGLGLRVAFTRHLHGEVYWGEELRDVEEPDDRDLQDTGVYFELVLEY